MNADADFAKITKLWGNSITIPVRSDGHRILLGRGRGGMVYFGYMDGGDMDKPIKVALKSSHSIEAFKEEALYLWAIRAPNIISLYGIHHHDNVDYLVLDYCNAGSVEDVLKQLANFFKKNKRVIHPEASFNAEIKDKEGVPIIIHISPANWLKIAFDVCKTLKVLMDGRSFIHGDIAARNVCLKVSDKGEITVFLVDFGRSGCPKESAPEVTASTADLAKSSTTAIYAFGAFVWDLFSIDIDSYDRYSMHCAVRRRTKMYEKPSYCPTELFAVASLCLSENPSERPSFNDMCENIKGMMNNCQLHHSPRFDSAPCLVPSDACGSSSGDGGSSYFTSFGNDGYEDLPRFAVGILSDDILRHQLFVGRNSEMNILGEKMRKFGKVVVHGIGGKGKSVIARRYALQMYEEHQYQCVLWFDCRRKASFRLVFLEAAKKLCMTIAEDIDEKHLVTVVRKKLKKLFGPGKACLFVFDNAMSNKDIESYYDQDYHVLVTARFPNTFRMVQVEPHYFTLRDTIEVFNQILDGKSIEEDDAKSIHEIMGGLPLGTVIAASWVKRASFCGKVNARAWVDAYKRNPQAVLSFTAPELGFVEENECVYHTFRMMVDVLPRDARRMLCLAALGNVDIISTVTLRIYWSDDSSYDTVLSELLMCRLVDLDLSRVKLHCLLQKAMLCIMKEDMQTFRQMVFDCVRSLSSALPWTRRRDASNPSLEIVGVIDDSNVLLTHACEALKQSSGSLVSSADKKVYATLNAKLGDYLVFETRRLDDAAKFLHSAYHLFQDVEDCLEKATCLNDYGYVATIKHQGRLDLHEKAQGMAGDCEEEIRFSQFCTGYLYFHQVRNMEEARKWLLRVEAEVGEPTYSTLFTLMNLGKVGFESGEDLEVCYELMDQSLKQAKVLHRVKAGTEDHSIAIALPILNMGKVAFLMKKYELAAQHFGQVLRIYKEVHGLKGNSRETAYAQAAMGLTQYCHGKPEAKEYFYDSMDAMKNVMTESEFYVSREGRRSTGSEEDMVSFLARYIRLIEVGGEEACPHTDLKNLGRKLHQK